MKKINRNQLQEFSSQDYSIRIQSNGLVFIGKKIPIDTNKVNVQIRSYSVLKEEVYFLEENAYNK